MSFLNKLRFWRKKKQPLENQFMIESFDRVCSDDAESISLSSPSDHDSQNDRISRASLDKLRADWVERGLK